MLLVSLFFNNFVPKVYNTHKNIFRIKIIITNKIMKKSLVACALICTAFVFASCGSNKESAYRKAYEKARAQEQTTVVEQPQTVTPVVERPATETQVQDNYDNVNVRSENVTVISGSGLKGYSVVVGSFGLKANAEGMASRLKGAGYDAQIVYNSGNNMYRVVASTFADKGSAVRSRDAIRSQYADAWLLYTK